MSYFATAYTIHFDDTMAYGSHHFLTAFKWQCASREAFLFGDRIFDMPGVRLALDQVHLLTVEAYARNLSPAKLGDRLAILLSLEQWGQASARFCYRVLGQQGQAVCAGYQTLVCADAQTQSPMIMPAPLQQAMNAMREIEEPWGEESFRDRVLAGGSKLDDLFGAAQREVSRQFLGQRYPSPQIVGIPQAAVIADVETLSNVELSSGVETLLDVETLSGVEALPEVSAVPSTDVEPARLGLSHQAASGAVVTSDAEVWLFGGQATFDARLFSQRLIAYAQTGTDARGEIDRSRQVAAALLDAGSSDLFFSGSEKQCQAAVKAIPALKQVAIYWQNVLGAKQWAAQGHTPRVLLGHSFGETAALCVAGCFDLVVGTHVVCTRIQAIAQHAPAGGGLLIVACDALQIDSEVKLLGLDSVVLAGRNHPTQIVMSGPLQQLQRLRSHLETIRISAMIIDSPASFHHPDLQAAASTWCEALRQLPLQPPAVLVYSSIHQRMIADGDDLAAVLAEQLTKPFDFQAAIGHMLADGLISFVDCGSSGAIARLVLQAGFDELTAHCVARELPTAAPAPELARNQVPRVAIVGTGCILPAGVTSPRELFSAITEQRLGIVDQQLFDPHWSEDFYSAALKPDRSNSYLFGRVLDSGLNVPDGVDPGVFDAFTRTQKLLCIALAPCIDSLRGAQRIVCLVGSTADGFEDQDEVSSLRLAGIDPSHPEIDRRMHSARSASHTPHSAVQQVFDLLIRPGLQVTLVDAACASSLYTLTLGMQMLESDRVDAVIAGGFFCPGPGNSCLFSQFRGMTATGCRPFDADADGVVFSEGAALVTLRRMVDVKRYGLTVEAVVAGAGLSSDGRSPSANVPQTRGQLLAIERCYANYDIDPSSITAIEGHGTSTPVGDGTELETLRRFFSGRTAQPIPVHSLKGLLGHAGWAAGTASVIAVCEYIRNGLFPAQAMHRQPSTALLEAAGTLVVPTSPVELSSPTQRIAIDGFGFGGANAHLVLEKCSPDLTPIYAARNGHPPPAEAESAPRGSSASATLANSQQLSREATLRSEELVIVAQHCEWPSQPDSQFDRSQIQAPPQHIILPQLADDMDISQALAIRVTSGVLGQVPQLDAALRRETSLILAMSGKTQRSIEATLRILAPRLLRNLPDDAVVQQQIDRAYRAARPSGPYTLQCMMPNVAAGRAALLLNLNGPNFVVDAGRASLAAALSSAASLLSGGDRSGTKLVVVAAIAAQGDFASSAEVEPVDREVAAAFLVTTRRLADELHLPVISNLDDVYGTLQSERENLPQSKLYEQVRSLQLALETAQETPRVESSNRKSAIPTTPPQSSAPMRPSPQPAATSGGPQLHAPVWVEKAIDWVASRPAGKAPEQALRPRAKHMLVIVKAGFSRLAELLAALPEVAENVTLAVVGESASRAIADADSLHSNANWLAVDIDSADPALLTAALDRLCHSTTAMDVVCVVDEPLSWDLLPALAELAHDNSLCELLFLIAQRQADQLRAGRLELWGLFLQAWNGQVHPSTGPTAGLLKSIQREFPAARTGTVCTQGLDISAALHCLRNESAIGDGEPELVYTPTQRLVRRLQPVNLESTTSLHVQATPQVELNRQSVVVAIGGAKGVTAVMLDALLYDHQCTAIAIGRSPPEAGPDNIDSPEVEQAYYAKFIRDQPNANAAEMKRSFDAARGRWEAHQTVQRLRMHGGRVDYVVADITDPAQVAAVIEQIVGTHQKIDLLLYGAGVQKSKRLEDRSLGDFRTVFSAKVSGLHNVVSACFKQLGRRVPAHVLTSAYSLFGNDGQHDYGAANETLDRLCSLTQVGDLPPDWTSLAWLAWDAVGMTRGSEYRALAKQRRLSGIDPITGQQMFRQVMGGKTRSAINVPLSTAEHVQYAVRTIPPAAAGLAGRIVEMNVPLADMACLPFHQVRNVPTLPGAWIVDAFVGAARRVVENVRVDMQVVIQDLSFARFVRLAHQQDPNVRVVAQQCGQHVAVWMLADILHSTGVLLAKDQLCASAIMVFNQDEPISSVTIPNAHRVAAGREILQDPYCQQSPVVQLSGLFDCLSEIELHEQMRHAKVGSVHSPASYHHIPALLLDAAWRVGAMYTPTRPDELFVPTLVGRISLALDSLSPVCSTIASSDLWEIRSTAPRASGKEVRWARTEVYNGSGQLKIVIEDARATALA